MPVDALGLKVELQALGLRLQSAPSLASRSGGAGPADGVTLFIDCLVATVPTNAAYVLRSPYSLAERDGGYMLSKDGSETRAVEVADEPAFLSGEASSGMPFNKVALRHGADAIGSTVIQACARGEDACRFCGIALTRSSGATAGLKDPADLGELAAAASAEGYSHAVLTTGTTGFEDRGIAHLERCAKAVDDATGGRIKTHVQFEPPGDPAWIDKAAGCARTAAINMECFDEGVLERVAPGKAATGLAAYEAAWKSSVGAFGAGRVACFIIAGLGETDESVLAGCELLCSLGVFPYVLPLRPVPGTPMETASPPGAGRMTALYEKAATIVGRSGLTSSMSDAGCIRCGACSAITDLV